MKKLLTLSILPAMIILLACGPYGPGFTTQSVADIKVGKSGITEIMNYATSQFSEMTLKRGCFDKECKESGIIAGIPDMGLQFHLTGDGQADKYKISKITLEQGFYGYSKEGLLIGSSTPAQVRAIYGEPDAETAEAMDFSSKGFRLAFEDVDWQEDKVAVGMEMFEPTKEAPQAAATAHCYGM